MKEIVLLNKNCRGTKKNSFIEISLLIGSTANYAGDGPTRKDNCLSLNGIYIIKRSTRYHIEDINQDVLRRKFANCSININDEVIKVNQFYCEHLGNVAKYIERTPVRYLQLRNVITGQTYSEQANETIHMEETLQRTAISIPTSRKRKVSDRQYFNDALDEEAAVLENNSSGDIFENRQENIIRQASGK